MARTKGSFSLAGTMEVLADAPADARLQVKTVADLTASGSFQYKYVGMIVSVEATQDAYMLIGSDPTVAANWQKMGESQVSSLSDLSDVDLTNITDGQILKWDATNHEWVNAEDSGGVSDYADLTSKPSINNVTLSGNKTTSDLGISYNDLTNKPTIPDDISDLSDVNVSSPSNGQILKYDGTSSKWVNSAESAGVTDYADLTSKPSINSVTLSGNKTTADLGISYADLTNKPTIPTKTSDLTNDSGFITSSSVPTKTSDLTNDSGFLTSVSASDVGLGNVVNTSDSAIPVQNGITKFTTGGAYTELAKKLDKPTYKTETLSAGSTSVTFTDMPTTGTNLVDFFASNGMNYLTIAESGTSVTVTFEEQASDVEIYCRIEGV